MSSHTQTPITNSESPADQPSGFWTLFFSDVPNLLIIAGVFGCLLCIAATVFVSVVR